MEGEELLINYSPRPEGFLLDLKGASRNIVIFQNTTKEGDISTYSFGTTEHSFPDSAGT